LTAENGRVTIPPNLKNKDVEPKEYAAKRVLESGFQGCKIHNSAAAEWVGELLRRNLEGK
jgi:hypothetical protein